jgi:hypothetical protein
MENSQRGGAKSPVYKRYRVVPDAQKLDHRAIKKKDGKKRFLGGDDLHYNFPCNGLAAENP